MGVVTHIGCESSILLFYLVCFWRRRKSDLTGRVDKKDFGSDMIINKLVLFKFCLTPENWNDATSNVTGKSRVAELARDAAPDIIRVNLFASSWFQFEIKTTAQVERRPKEKCLWPFWNVTPYKNFRVKNCRLTFGIIQKVSEKKKQFLFMLKNSIILYIININFVFHV